MSKNDPKITVLDKYDVEAAIEEIDNGEESSVFKYCFTALSNPKNVRLSIEGIAHVFGSNAERDKVLCKDEKNVPKILTIIYQELFPTFFLLSKSLNVSCPPHTIGTMGCEPISEPMPEIPSEKIQAGVSGVISEHDPKVSESQAEPATMNRENLDMVQPTV